MRRMIRRRDVIPVHISCVEVETPRPDPRGEGQILQGHLYRRLPHPRIRAGQVDAEESGVHREQPSLPLPPGSQLLLPAGVRRLRRLDLHP